MRKEIVFNNIICPNCRNIIVKWCMDGAILDCQVPHFYFKCDMCGAVVEAWPVLDSHPMLIKRTYNIETIEVTE